MIVSTTTTPLRIAVTGATGLVGSALVPLLTTLGHTVLTLSRSAGPGRILWDPARGQLDAAALDGVDAVIHLAGASVAKRWSAAHKHEILASRVDSTRLLATTLAGLRTPPRVLVVASGIGWYGPHHDDRARTEDDPAGTDFLAEVCRAWETAANPARAAGIRTVHARIGMVLSARGGALTAMLPAFRFGAGGPIGGGRQWQSWIQLEDLIDVLHRAVMDPALSGPLNVVAPDAVRPRTQPAGLRSSACFHCRSAVRRDGTESAAWWDPSFVGATDGHRFQTSLHRSGSRIAV